MRTKTGMVVFFVLACSFVSLGGCPKGERDRVSRESNQLVHLYRVKMERGETTPEQDKKFIAKIDDQILQIDRAIRGKEKADKSRAEAEAISNGIDPNAPLDLSDPTPAEPQSAP